MAGLQDYLQEQEDLNPVPLDVGDYMAVTQSANPQAGPSPALQKYLGLAGQAAGQEQAGVNQLQQYITDLQAKPKEIDYRPLAAWADSLKPGGNVMASAEAMKPQSEEQRQAQIASLQEKLQERRGALTKTQLGFVGNQMKQEMANAQREQANAMAHQQFGQKQDLLREKMANDQLMQRDRLEQEKIRTQAYKEANDQKLTIAQMQLDAAKAAREAAQQKADERQQAGLDQKGENQIADQMLKIGKDLSGELPSLSGNVKKIEDLIGGSLDAYDPKTHTLDGKPVDLPGISLPGVGRVALPGSKGEEFDTAFKGIFNSLLKERSGSAVTNQELARMRSEFAAGRFNTEEKMVEALQRFKKALRSEMLQKEKSYKPEAVQRFKDQGGMLTEDLLGMNAPPPQNERKEYQGKTYEKQGDTWVEVK